MKTVCQRSYLFVIATLVVVYLIGCGSRLDLEGDTTVDPSGTDTDIPVDSPSDEPLDSTDTACDPAYWWELEPRTINSVSHIDGVTPRMGVTERLRVEVQLRSACEFLGWVDVAVECGDATDAVTISAEAWVPQGMDCPPSAPIVTWMVEVPGREHGNLHVAVLDGNSPGGGMRLTYDRDACSGVPDCSCRRDTPAGTGAEGSACVTDCSCQEGLSCISYFGIGGPMWSCHRLCNDFRDCLDGESCLPPVLDFTSNVCSTHGSDCETDEDCPYGYECDIDEESGGRCMDLRDTALYPPFDCECDDECRFGQRCLRVGDMPEHGCAPTCMRITDCSPSEECLHGACSPPL